MTAGQGGIALAGSSVLSTFSDKFCFGVIKRQALIHLITMKWYAPDALAQD
jgi:hypothetical protein